jgi:DNA-binding transcriptional MerR regulator
MAILDDYMTIDALAAEINVSVRTIARYEREPDGLPTVMLGGRKYYRIAAIQEWLTKRERHPNPRREGWRI